MCVLLLSAASTFMQPGRSLPATDWVKYCNVKIKK
jgi:hypothetical protein